MSERYKPQKLKRERSTMNDLDLPRFTPKPREQTVWRDGKPKVIGPLLCRLHNQPWQTCTLCSKAKPK